MSLNMAQTTSHAVVGEKSCILCNRDFDYVAMVSGGNKLDELQLLYKGKEITDQVVVLKKSHANNHQLQIIDVEITVRCPHCFCKNRFDHFFTIGNSVHH